MKLSKITYAGHSAVLFQAGDKIIGIDPWLSGNPICPEELRNPEKMDLILLTHGHADHASDALSLAKEHGSIVAATYELAMILVNEGVPQSNVLPMNKGGTVQWEGLSISLTNAYHSSSYQTAQGTVYAGEACGIILSDGTTTIYHAGDTSLFSDMNLIREQYQPSISFLPCGDCFTMGPKEAAKAAKIVGSQLNIPIHHSTFGALTGTPEQFEIECKNLGVEALPLKPGAEHSL